MQLRQRYFANSFCFCQHLKGFIKSDSVTTRTGTETGVNLRLYGDGLNPVPIPFPAEDRN